MQALVDQAQLHNMHWHAQPILPFGRALQQALKAVCATCPWLLLGRPQARSHPPDLENAPLSAAMPDPPLPNSMT